MAINRTIQEERAVAEREDELQGIMSCLYASGCRIEDYTKVLLYLQSSVHSSGNSKKEVLENWTIPYIESLVLFFAELKKDSELMEANRNYIKY